jgi:hypothetical protein
MFICGLTLFNEDFNVTSRVNNHLVAGIKQTQTIRVPCEEKKSPSFSVPSNILFGTCLPLKTDQAA